MSINTLVESTLGDEKLPSYREHRLSARCEEDLMNPAPAYMLEGRGEILSQPSGADKLAEWLASCASRRVFTWRPANW